MDGESKYKPETVSKESLIVKDYSRNLQKIHKSEILMNLQVISYRFSFLNAISES